MITEYLPWIWFAAAIIFLLLEGATEALVSLWFVGGALAALGTALLGGPEWLQIVLFFVVSAGLLFLLRPMAKKYLKPRPTATNAAANIGKTALVAEDIDNLLGKGTVKISGVFWSARSKDNHPISKNTPVTIVGIEGVKVIVKEETA